MLLLLISSFQQLKMWVILRMMFYFFITIGASMWLKLILMRRDISKHLPGMKVSSFDVLGNLQRMPRNAHIRKLCTPNAYVLQHLSALTRLFRHQELFCFWLSYSPVVVFVKAEAVEELISGTKMMDKSWHYNFLHDALGTGLVTSSGSKWKSHRKLLTPAFHFDILKTFLPAFNEQSEILVNILQKESQKPWINIMDHITLCSLDIICETSIGVKLGAQKNSKSEYVQALFRISSTMMKRMLNPMLWVNWLVYCSASGRQFKDDVKLIKTYTKKFVREKKELLLRKGQDSGERKRKALLDLLLDHHMKNEDFTEEDVREEVDTFGGAGHDTTSMGMSWALYLIGLYPDVQEKVHEELDLVFGEDTTRPISMDDINDLKYLDRVLKESQRLYPPTPVIARQVNKEITIRGYKIPKDTACAVLIYELHRDEKVFPNPEKFDPDRFLPENTKDRHPYAYIPFSAGPRNCIGQRFAVIEQKVVLANVLRNFHLKSLQHRDVVIPSPEIVLNSSQPLKIKLSLRHT